MILIILTVIRMAFFRIKNIRKLNEDKFLILNENQIKHIKNFN